MSKRNFDYKKRLNAKSKLYKKRTIALATSFVLVAGPIAMSGSLPGLSINSVQAATLADVNLLTNTTVSATLGNFGGTDPYSLSLGLTGQGVADAGVLAPEKVAVFYAPELAGKMTAVGPADVRVEILPITMDDLGTLNETLNGVTTVLTGTVTEVLSVVDQLQSSLIPNELLTINGISELESAVDALNNIDDALTDLLAYEDTIETTIAEDGSITVDFSDGLGNHLETAINEVVVTLLEDVVTALNGVELAILPGAEEIPGVGLIIGGLNDLVNGVLGTVTGTVDEVVGLIDDITDGTIDLTNDLVGLQVIGQTSVNLNVNVDKPIGIIGDVEVTGAAVNTGVIDLELLGSLTDSTTVTFNDPDEGDGDADADDLILDIPSVNDVYDGDTEITGTGESGSTIQVEDEAGNELGSGVVAEDGNFTVELETPLVEGMELEVTQSQENENGETVESDPAYLTVQPSDDNGADGGITLEAPSVNDVFDGDAEVTGTGESGSTVQVEDGAGNELGTGVVAEDGNFTVELDAPLEEGMELEVTQSQEDENGETVESDPVYVTVQPSDNIGDNDGITLEAPSVNDVFDGDAEVTGTGESGSTIQVEDGAGNELGSGVVAEDGNFTVELETPLVEGMELEVTQSQEDENGETVESDPVYVTVQPSDNIGDNDGITLEAPSVNDVFDGDAEVTGEGEPGATIQVEDEAGNELGSGVVAEDGNFTVELETPLVEGMELEVTQSQENENGETVESDPAYLTVQPSDDNGADGGITLEAPSVNDVYDGDTEVTGTGESGATVQVEDEAGNELGTGVVAEDGKFTVELETPLVEGMELEVTQSQEDENGETVESDPAYVTVQPSDDNGADGGITLEAPSVNDVYDGDTEITGSGESGATVQVEDEAGNELGTGVVAEDGKFTVELETPLVEGMKLEVTQSQEDENGETVESDPVYVTVQPSEDNGADDGFTLEAPFVNDVYDGDTAVTGKGEPRSTVHVKNKAGNELGSGLVDEDGNFTVELGTPLVEGMELEVTQSQENENGERVESAPTNVTVQQVDTGDGDADGQPGTSGTPGNQGTNGNVSGFGNSNSNTLPNTATGIWTVGATGLGALLAGLGARLFGRRRKQ
ncbi:Ig-like domain-containing protein [Lederbergia lenta]|uniref:Ig-like domain-containing protein n=2 Tax=Lederbergia lenta TaxID=1467 RepID=UPI00203A816D|nr:Ig-like domain-containing protein [Lederbergia lenta]MCM3111907.1 Ig-like domain-containing protein [Lederbergia lenta]